MKKLPPTNLLEKAITVSTEIEDFEFAVRNATSFDPIDIDDYEIYLARSNKGEIRLWANGRPLGDYPMTERVTIWLDVKDLVKRRLSL